MLLNGRPSETVSLQDRGLHFGDGLFETIAVVEGKLPLWHRHFDRLSWGCERLGIAVPDEKLLSEEVFQLVEPVGRHAIKLILTRGCGGTGYFPPKPRDKPHRILLSRPWPQVGQADYSQGIPICICRTKLTVDSPLAGLKHLNRLEQVLAAREASNKGYQEGILFDTNGRIIEAIQANLFLIKGGMLYTPRIDRSGVAGVMRAELIDRARLQGYQVAEENLTIDELMSADALFITNALLGILPIRAVDERQFAVEVVPRVLLRSINQDLLKWTSS